MINYLFWNIRGVSYPPNFHRLHHIICQFAVPVVALSEPKMDPTPTNVSLIKRRLHLDSSMVYCRGSSRLFFSSLVCCSLVGESDQHLTIQTQSNLFSSPIVFFSCMLNGQWRIVGCYGQYCWEIESLGSRGL